MDTTTKIKMLMARYGMTGTELAARLEMTQSNLSKKLSKGKFSFDEMEQIAKVFNAEYESTFILEDGEKI